jgi:hypothetical protein
MMTARSEEENGDGQDDWINKFLTCGTHGVVVDIEDEIEYV